MNASTPASPGLPEAALAALLRGQKIEAIRLTREALGLGLKEAKERVEAHIEAEPHLKAQLTAARASGRRGCLLFLAALAALALGISFLAGRGPSWGRRPSATPRPKAALQQQVMDTERAFAKAMASRDHGAFSAFLAEEAVFFSGDRILRGRQAVAEGWKRHFEKPEAPFSWEPERVEVLDSGQLALSTGPVRDPSGKPVATFTSIWRWEDGAWRIVFDKGNPICDKP